MIVFTYLDLGPPVPSGTWATYDSIDVKFLGFGIKLPELSQTTTT